MNRSNALVLGATGALGRALVEVSAQHTELQIVQVSRSLDSVQNFRLDICDTATLADVLNATRPKLIINSVASFSTDMQAAYALNVKASRKLLELVKKADWRPRVLLIGSAAEYGRVSLADNPITEQQALKPVSIYGLTKAWQTQLMYYYAAQGVDVRLARVFNLFGPGVSPQLFAGRVQQQIEQVLSGQRENITVGSLSATRDYLSTTDAAAQLFSIANYAPTGSVHHVASGIGMTMRELLKARLFESGLSESIVFHDEDQTSHTGHDTPVVYADVSKTQRLMREKESYVEA